MKMNKKILTLLLLLVLLTTACTKIVPSAAPAPSTNLNVSVTPLPLNVSIVGENGTTAVDVIDLFGTSRLAVDNGVVSTLTTTRQLTNFTLIPVPLTFVTLVNLSTTGVIDQIIINTNSQTYEIRVTIDDTVLYYFNLSDLANVLALTDGSDGTVIYAYNTRSGFVDLATNGLFFTTMFTIEMRNTNVANRDVLGYMVRYRTGV